MRYLTVLAAMMGLGAVPSTVMANNACSTEMYKQADASLVGAGGGWASLLKHQKTFHSCDDGALAEGYSDAVVTLLANRWDQFDVFVTLSERNPAFRRWAIRHIDTTASTDDLKRVLRNAARCTGSPKTMNLCGEVGRAARSALRA
jgi:hypothetical protein